MHVDNSCPSDHKIIHKIIQLHVDLLNRTKPTDVLISTFDHSKFKAKIGTALNNSITSTYEKLIQIINEAKQYCSRTKKMRFQENKISP